jgi:hypothetical protein
LSLLHSVLQHLPVLNWTETGHPLRMKPDLPVSR